MCLLAIHILHIYIVHI